MSDLSLPQTDRSTTRKAEIDALAKTYRYNQDAGIPLQETPGPKDLHSPNWDLQMFRVLLRLRNNLDEVVRLSGFKFEKSLVKRDPRTLMTILKSGGEVVDYYSPDLGAIVPSGRPSSIEDYRAKVFKTEAPPPIAARFDTDEQFGYTFLAGPNPNQLQRMTSVPANFPVATRHLQMVPEFADDDLAQAITEGRAYFVDHSGLSFLQNGSHPQQPKYISAPFAGFVVPRSGPRRLYPFAIQCGPTPQGRTIYTPADGYSWKIARNHVLAAHNTHHEVVSHLGLTHLIIDPIVMATRRNLHVRHPVHALLNIHFEGTAEINYGARTSLVKPGKSVDRLTGTKVESFSRLLGEERLKFSFRDNYLPNRLARLGVMDTKLLPVYPYRDDGLLLWNAIRQWMSDYVGYFYRTEADLRADGELQAWAREVTEQGKVRDFGVAPGTVRDRADLIDILTMIIFTAGPQHAAVNFAQATDMAFIPANPLAVYVPEPKGRDHSEQDWLDSFPPLDVAVHSWAILNMLAGIYHTRLGDYRYLYTKTPVQALLTKFKTTLTGIETTIQERNKTRFEYLHLLPSRIPASINI